MRLMSTVSGLVMAMAVSAMPRPGEAEQALLPAALQLRLVTAAQRDAGTLQRTAATLARRAPHWREALAFEALALTLERAVAAAPESGARYLQQAIAAAEARDLLKPGAGSARALRERARAASERRALGRQVAAPQYSTALSDWSSWSISAPIDTAHQRLAEVAETPHGAGSSQLAQAVFAQPGPDERGGTREARGQRRTPAQRQGKQRAAGWPTGAEPATDTASRRGLYTALSVGLAAGGGGALAWAITDNSGSEPDEAQTLPIGNDATPNPLGEGSERENTEGFALINAGAAFDFVTEAFPDGLSGLGTTVGVVGAGIAPNHPEFVKNLDGNVAIGAQQADPVGQGAARSTATAAASLIAAEQDGVGLHGIAPRAQVIGYRAITSAGAPLFGPIEQAGLAPLLAPLADSDVAVVTFPIADDEPQANGFALDADAEALVTDTDQVFVFPTGDDGTGQPQDAALVPALTPAAESAWLAVTATDANSELAAFSNACGNAAAWCLAAPGAELLTAVDIADTAFDRASYAEQSGTALAAAHAGGALAILLERFPELTPQEARQILIDTARDLGEPGVDPLFGHGLIDLEAAIQPQGTVMVSGVAGEQHFALADTRIRLGRAFGDGLDAALSGHGLAVEDAFGRGYGVALNALAQGASSGLPLRRALRQYGRGAVQRTALGPRFAVGYRMTQQTDRLRRRLDPLARQTAADGPDLDRASAHFGLGGGSSVNGYYGMTAGLGLAHHDAPDLAGMHIDPAAHQNAFLALAGEGWLSVIEVPAATDLKLTVAAFGNGSGDETNIAAQGGLVRLRADDIAGPGSGSLSFSTGALIETGGILGSAFSGAFALAQPGRTAFGSVGYRRPLAGLADVFGLSGLTVGGRIEGGLTSYDAGADGLVTGTGRVVTTSYGVMFSAAGLRRKSDTLSLALYQPLRVERGRLRVAVPGHLDTAPLNARLAPRGRELALSGTYALETAAHGRLSTGLVLRRQPDHRRDTALDIATVLRWETPL